MRNKGFSPHRLTVYLNSRIFNSELSSQAKSEFYQEPGVGAYPPRSAVCANPHPNSACYVLGRPRSAVHPQSNLDEQQLLIALYTARKARHRDAADDLSSRPKSPFTQGPKANRALPGRLPPPTCPGPGWIARLSSA